MRIYVDFDDCLCETARHFSGLVADLFGKDVPYENISFFKGGKASGSGICAVSGLGGDQRNGGEYMKIKIIWRQTPKTL